jgi:sec-independent protein translocase protein TatB
MFGMGWSEIVLIGIVGVLVFGPDKLPEFARQSARLVRTVRRMAQDAKDDLGRELGHDLSGLQLRDLDPREVVRRTLLEEGEALQPGSGAQGRDAGERAERAPRVPPKAPELPRSGDRPPVDPDAT